MGDLKKHHKKWLRWSNRNSPEGALLADIVADAGLYQIVRDPTRKEYLLDLVLTGLGHFINVQVIPGISDHSIVELEVSIPAEKAQTIQRKVWNLKKANWKSLKQGLSEIDWADHLGQDIHAATDTLTSTIHSLAMKHIGKRDIEHKKSNYPWMTEDAVKAIQEKAHAATVDRDAATKRCNEVLGAEYQNYVETLREEIKQLPSGSKK